MSEGPKSPKKKKKLRLAIHFKFVDKLPQKSLERKFQKKIQTAFDGTENTVKTDTGKMIPRKNISWPLLQTEVKSSWKFTAITSGEITPKNRHCLRGLDGKYGR